MASVWLVAVAALVATAATQARGCPSCVILRGVTRCRDVSGFPLARLGMCVPPDTRVLNLDGAGVGPVGPRSFALTRALRALELSDNPVVMMHEDALAELRWLESFSCRNCSLDSLQPRTFWATPRLVELDLSWNHLRVLTPDLLESLPALRVLRVLRNHLKVISPPWLKGHQDLVLRAQGNVWNCDCPLYYMMQALAIAGVDHDVALDVCESPIHYRGVLLKAIVRGTC